MSQGCIDRYDMLIEAKHTNKHTDIDRPTEDAPYKRGVTDTHRKSLPTAEPIPDHATTRQTLLTGSPYTSTPKRLSDTPTH